MKKILATLVVLFSIASFCRAQDTVQYMDPCYLFNEKHPYTVYPWPPFFNIDSNYYAYFDPVSWGWDGLCSKPYHNMEYYSYGYPIQEPVLVYGVALTLVGQNDVVLKEDDMENYPYDVIIGRVENNKVVAIDSTTWNSNKDAIALFKYSLMGDSVLYEHVVPVYEFYFDTPHLMTDTFYVGFRLTVNDTEMLDRRVSLVLAVDSVSTLDTVVHPFDYVYHPYVYNDDIHARLTAHWYWGGEFPILQPNRRCSAPEGAPQLLVYNTTNTVRFTLPYSPDDSLLLAICGYGLPMDSATVYPVTDSIMDIVVPDSGRYTARLARVCQRDILVQSNWGDPTTFLIMNNLAIEQNNIPTLEVYPNPTDGSVRIDAEGIREVWCVASDGKRTQLSVKNGQVSLKAYPAGLYVLEIQTDEGLFSAKVVKR